MFEQLLNRNAGFRERSDSDAYTQVRNFLIVFQTLTDSVNYLLSGGEIRFREHQGEFVAAVTGRCVNRAGIQLQNRSHSTKRSAADHMSMAVVDFLEAIEIHEQNGKGPVGSSRTFQLALQNVDQVAVIGQASQAIADRKCAHLAEELALSSKVAPSRTI